MRISIDPLAKATYVEFKDDKVAKTKEFTPETFLDFNAKGELLGIELLNPCRVVFRKIAKKYHMPILNRLPIQPLKKIYQVVS